MEGRGLLGNKYQPCHPSMPRRRQNYVSQVAAKPHVKFHSSTLIALTKLYGRLTGGWRSSTIGVSAVFTCNAACPFFSLTASLRSVAPIVILLFANLNDILRYRSFISRTALRVKELQQFLKSIGIGVYGKNVLSRCTCTRSSFFSFSN